MESLCPLQEWMGLPDSHWKDVKNILCEVIDQTEFEGKLVSDEEATGIIHNSIVQNLYKNPIVVCDVSCRNPNVMFELGMRLAFDKPTVVIKDDQTDYTFDASPIDHLSYPRDLRYTDIESFKEKLKNKIISTHEAAKEQNYSTFLKTFGEFKVVNPETVEVGVDDYIMEELRSINKKISRMDDIRNQSFRMKPLSVNNAFRDSSGRYSILSTAPDSVDTIRYRVPTKKDDIINLDLLQGRLNEMFKDIVIIKQETDRDGSNFLSIFLPMHYITSKEEAGKLLHKALLESGKKFAEN